MNRIKIPLCNGILKDYFYIMKRLKTKDLKHNKNPVEKYILLTTVSVVTLLCSATMSAHSAGNNDWIGGVNGDYFDPANWSAGTLPQWGEEVTVNQGSAIGAINLASPVSYTDKMPNNIGNGADADGSVIIDIKTDPSDNYNSVSLDFGDTLTIGGNGGTGLLNFELDGAALAYLRTENIIIGSGSGSHGTMNLIGAGKDNSVEPEGPLLTGDVCSSCSPNYHIDQEVDILIGNDGGTGTLNLDGSTLSFMGRQDFIVGNGGGSQGAINVLADGKLGDAHNYNVSDYTQTSGQFTVGLSGGSGIVNINGTSAADRASAPLALFGQGLNIGQGTNSTGEVNILSKGKVHSYIRKDMYDYYINEGLSRSALDTRVGIDGGTGIINISGDGSVWYQSGVLNDYLYPGAEIVTSDAGVLRIGESGNGELAVSDGGVMRIGSAVFTSVEDPDNGYPLLELSDHIADGTLMLGVEAAGKGVLSIGGAQGQAAKAAGRLMAKTIAFGAGEGTVRFNHTETNYVFDQFDAQYKSGSSRPTSIDFTGNGALEAVASRTLLVNDHIGFAGNLRASGSGILQVNGDMSATTASIMAGGTLEGTGMVGMTTNSGIIAPGRTPDGAQGLLSSIGTLTIAGDYTGTNGILSLDSVLGDNNSATDMLVITGNSTGSTNVVVTNINGNGAQTTVGIKIIDVGGTSQGDFKLLGDYDHNGQQAVVAGAYAYKLYQGGISAPADGDWYLRSELKTTDPVDPVDPLYQAGAPVYEVYPQALLAMNGVSTLQQRLGNRIWTGKGNRIIAQGADIAGSPYADASETGTAIESNGVWGRMEGFHNHMEPRFSTSGTDYNQNVFKMQAGIDGVLTENSLGKLIGGVTVHYAHGKTKVYSDHGNGEISTNGYGAGGTLSWFGENGFYIDAQGQATWYNSDLNSLTAKTNLTDGNHGFGYALSLESGKRFTVDETWALTPQAQVTYSHVDFDAFTDVFDTRVKPDRGESLQLRLGLTLDHETSWQNANGMLDRARVYGIANLYYEFLNGTRVNVAETAFSSRNDRLWGGLGVGSSYNWNNDLYSVYAEGLINTSLNNFADSYGVKGNLGFRMRW